MMRIEDERAMRVAYKNEFGVEMATGMHAHTWKAAWKAALRHVGILNDDVPALLRPKLATVTKTGAIRVSEGVIIGYSELDQ